ncbi:amidohydrolase [Isoptericola jiangsuensis]|uniref:amidohydrolase n=1 Tax=Isoptericola jiangsuensis TaxID=548579 RepID=UPI003AAC5B5F
MTSTLYHNGVVHTSADPFAEAILVDDGVVTWVGAQDTATGLAARADDVVDLDGALVTPGFVDAHTRLLDTGLAEESVDLGAATGPGDALDALAAGARALQQAAADRHDVLLAAGWDESRWTERRPPRRDELDAACDGRPVYAVRADDSGAVVSTSLARLAHLEHLPGWDPATGLVTGEAHRAARAAAHDVSAERRTRAYRTALDRAAAHGVVSVHEMSTPASDTRDGLRELWSLTQDPAAGMPHLVAYRGELCRTDDDARDVLADLPFLTGIGGALPVDGTLGARTAALRSPYTDLPPTSDPHPPTGELHLSAEDVAAHLAACSVAGTQGSFGVTGDRAMDEAVRALGLVAEAHGPSLLRSGHHRIEHALFVDAPALAALLLYGVALSVQPAFDSTFGGRGGQYETRLGAGRASALSPFADLAGAGVPLAFGSATPVTPVDPWAAVRATLTHDDTTQRISARAAFRAHTRGGWRLAGLDHTGAGELRVGAPAHLAVWQAEHLAVQSAEGRLSQWNPEARAGQPLLPDLSPDAPRPTCLRTVRDGVVLFDTMA